MNAIPSPVAANGMVYVTSGFRGNALQAIRLAGTSGDITDAEAIRQGYPLRPVAPFIQRYTLFPET